MPVDRSEIMLTVFACWDLPFVDITSDLQLLLHRARFTSGTVQISAVEGALWHKTHAPYLPCDIADHVIQLQHSSHDGVFTRQLCLPASESSDGFAHLDLGDFGKVLLIPYPQRQERQHNLRVSLQGIFRPFR